MSSSPSREVNLAQVEDVVAGGAARIRFPPPLEAYFEAVTGRERCRHLIIFGLLALFFYDLFLIADERLLNDVIGEALIVRIGVVTPLTLIAALVLTRNPPPWLRETIGAGMMLIAMGGAVYLLVRSSSPLAVYAHYPFVLVIVYCNVIQRLRFWYAATASSGCVAIYTVGVGQLHLLPPEAFSEAVFAVAATTAFTLFANFRLERDDRGVFLTALLDRLRRNQLARANDELSVISSHDPLTGLVNRRGLDLYLAAAWNASIATGQSIALLMLDVDHFKRFNDRYGHLAGDACLKELAHRARHELRRESDLIARFGGEEFLIVMPGASLLDGLRTAERIRRAIETHAITHGASPDNAVTVSIGVAAMPAAVTGLPIDLIRRADGALYRAKRNGRNCVWPPPGSFEDPAGAASAGRHDHLIDAA